MVTQSNHVVEVDGFKFLHELGIVAEYVHAGLGHDANRPRVQAPLLGAGRPDIDEFSSEVASPTLGHLAPT